MRALILLILAGLAIAETPAARIELFLNTKTGIKKQRFVDAVVKALGEKGLDVKKLPYEYAKYNGGAFRYDWNFYYFIHKGRRPMYKDVKAAMEEAPNDVARETIRDHKTWLALEASSTRHVAKDYRHLCRIAAELLGDDVLAIRFPARKAWIWRHTKDLATKLRAEDPLKALGIGATKEEQRQAEVAAVQAKATAEARKRFDEFKQAFRKREKTGATLFSVVYRKYDGEEESVSVKEIRSDKVKGFALSDWDKTVYLHEILDWSYRLNGKSHGNFRLNAALAHAKKKLDK